MAINPYDLAAVRNARMKKPSAVVAMKRRIRELEAELQVRDNSANEVLRILREATGKRDCHSEMEAAEWAAKMLAEARIASFKADNELNAAAELIRAGGWRAIAEAPDIIPPGRLGWWGTEKWFEVVTQYPIPKVNAITLGYTYYFPFDKPTPPALEDSKS